MKEAETLGWRQGMDNFIFEKETLRGQLASLELQLQSVNEESLSRGRKIEELKAISAAELAKAKSDAEAIMSSYQANAEAANARANEIFSAVEVKLSISLDHARAKILEEKATALLSDEDNSASGSESGESEDEVPECEALEGAAPEDAAAEDMTPK
ncbi:uncharacterized protein [Nicotiana sylvestris]|uniref:uncharacterized protein n=1 Tax=Nicotiana sylvestris TaxID=4096 RepID=UPI00388CCD85